MNRKSFLYMYKNNTYYKPEAHVRTCIYMYIHVIQNTFFFLPASTLLTMQWTGAGTPTYAREVLKI